MHAAVEAQSRNAVADAGRRATPHGPVQAPLLRLQRQVGNQVVAEMVASSRRNRHRTPHSTGSEERAEAAADRPVAPTSAQTTSLQRQTRPGTKPELPVPMESVEAVRAALTARQAGLNDFLTVAKQDVANIRSHFSFVNGVYRRCFDHHALVVAQANAQAQSKQAWVDFAFGVGVGVGVGLMSEVLIAGKLAEAAYETVAEVGAEMVEGGVSRFVKPEVPKAELVPDLAPELKQITSLQKLDELNGILVGVAVPGTYVYTEPLVQSERILAELRLTAAGVSAQDRTLTDTEVRERFAKLAKFEMASSRLDLQLAATRAAFDKLREAYFARPALTDELVEQDIWIPWIAAQDVDTFFAPTPFNKLIRQHLRDISMYSRLGAGGLPHYDSLLGAEVWPSNPATDEERAVVGSYQRQKARASAESARLPAFWNKVFLM